MNSYEIETKTGQKITIEEPCSLCQHHSVDDGYDIECGECKHFYGDNFTSMVDQFEEAE